MRIQLFRVKVYPPMQSSLFEGPFAPQLVLAETLRAKPKVELRRGYTWHVGNVEALDQCGLYFALGRTTKSTLAQFDESSGDFVESEFSVAPYTHIICDTAIELLGVVPKAELAPTAAGIARQLQRLLNESSQNQIGAQFQIDPINDPNEFIEQLRSAHAVRRFAITFNPPNPFDVNEQFHRPLERFLKQARGKKGKAAITGQDLDVEILEDLARSAAASGNDAEATLVKSHRSRPVRRRLKGDVATEAVDEELADEKSRVTVLSRMRAFYADIRGQKPRAKQ